MISETNQNLERIWLKSYETGVPATIDPDSVSSLVEMIETAFKTFNHQIAFANMGETLTYNELDRDSKAFAGFLQSQDQLYAGDKIAIMLPNILQYPIVLMGILRAKMTVVNVNPLYTPRELGRVLKDSEAKGIIVLENFAHVLQEVLPETHIKTIVVTQIGDVFSPFKRILVNSVVKYVKKIVPAWKINHAHLFRKTIKEEYLKHFNSVKIEGEDVAFLQYTGGTTGGIKGAILTHRNMVANLLQAQAWIKSLIEQHLHSGIITALPLYHIFSLTANCFTFFSIGIPNILITNPRDIKGFIKELKRQPFSVITGVNTLFSALLHHPNIHSVDFSTLKFTLGGGMAVQKPVAENWKKITGCPLLEAYGLTETCPAVAINPLYVKDYNGSIGLPLSSTDVKICDDNGKQVALGEAGELWVSGPQVTQGYWHQPQETARAFTDQWLHTGDIAKMDDRGFLYIVDRKKDVIIVSGFNVYPNEVEEVIAEIPAIAEVAVVGVPNPEHGEIVKAFIVSDDPNLTEADVIAHCRKELTGYKIPHLIEFRQELPKSNVGKVLRRLLREESH